MRENYISIIKVPRNRGKTGKYHETSASRNHHLSHLLHPCFIMPDTAFPALFPETGSRE
jgi:hypothetical protein